MRRVAALLLLPLLPWPVLCQATFEPIPREDAPRYRIDFARHFFAGPEAERAARAELYATLKELEGLKGKVARSAADLLRALRLNDEVQVRFNRHYNYLYLRHAVNTDDRASLSDASTLDAEVEARTAFLRRELMRLDGRTLDLYIRREPTLKTYLYAVESARRNRPYTLTLKEEELLSATAPLNREWQAELHNLLGVRARPGPATGTDPRAREEAFRKRYAALAASRDLYAFTLTRLAAAGDRLARLHHFADAPSEAYFKSYWSRAQVDDLLAQLARHADLYKRYQRLRAEHVGRLTGTGEVNLWDVQASPAGLTPPRYTIGQATRIIRDALAPLGPEYGRELADLLDPSNGRMDIVPGARRRRGGFSKGFIGTESVFYAAGFGGYYNDVRVLTHESTHAVQRQLMTRSRVPPAYASGPHYLFEAFAIFNELLLPDYLYNRETDPRLKQFYLEQFFEGKGMVMFVVAPEVAVEHAVYDGVARGTVKGADDLDALTKRIYSRYSI
jgi:oligoendopeptidase F